MEPERFTAGGMWAVPPSPWAVDSPELLVQRGEALECIEEVLAELPAHQRAVVTLRGVEGLRDEGGPRLLPWEEAADAIGQGFQGVDDPLDDGLHRIDQLLEQEEEEIDVVVDALEQFERLLGGSG